MGIWEELRSLVRAHLGAGKNVQVVRRFEFDLKKARRAANFPFLLSPYVKLVLSDPEERLVVYGTLVPGGRFHHLLADLPAKWEKCTIRGSLGSCRGYPAFKWNPAGKPHPAWLVTSPDLPGKYRELDDFEGENYTRRLIPVEAGSRLVIACIYEGRVKA